MWTFGNFSFIYYFGICSVYFQNFVILLKLVVFEKVFLILLGFQTLILELVSTREIHVVYENITSESILYLDS